ncbi:DUF5333 domain-containing protein [Hasllibacter sp. MH4015]|uniref:DUF5333 domain-containing protein n=1 Tax=Hasllibacter sp. MH4015 TaxID=2854029 RepID=UPI001CD63907|nr:DUF5333 domain-containing protein [Hasllibacter sp. MH4015]
MITPFRIVAAAGVMLVTGLFTTIGHAQDAQWQPLRDDPEIHSGLTVISVGRHIQNQCEDISPRLVRAWAFAEGLVGRAQDLGFTRAQVDAFIADRTEQDRYRAIMRQWFAQQGADADDAASVCRVGRDEITAGSQIGRLLRAG